MFHSFRWRLLFAFALVIAVALGTTAFFASQAARLELKRAQDTQTQEQERRLEQFLTQQYIRLQGWQSIQPDIKMAGQASGKRVILIDSRNIVVGDSSEALLGRALDPQSLQEGRAALVYNRFGERGWLLIDPSPLPDSPASPEPEGPLSINRYLIWSGMLAGALALGLTFFFSWRLLAPVVALSRAAEGVARRDFSQRVKVTSKDEIGDLARTFNTMTEELGNTEQVRRNMVADVAHELRTPLSNIQGLVEAMRDGLVKPDDATLDSIHEEVTLLARLVEDLQELALAESGQLPLHMQQCDLGEIVRRAVLGIQPQAEMKGIAVKAEVAGPAPVVGDTERLGQVVRNLLSNAVKYTDAGGQVVATVADRGGEVEVSVQDTGIGIAQEDLSHVFDRFYRVDKSRTRATGGTGLGLTIARELVRAHGGRIDARSEVGQGSTFYFVIPKAQAAEDREAPLVS